MIDVWLTLAPGLKKAEPRSLLEYLQKPRKAGLSIGRDLPIMLDTKWLRENLEEAETRLATRGEKTSLAAFRDLDGRRRELLRTAEELKELRNRVSDEIGLMKKQGQDCSARIEEMRSVSGRIKDFEKDLAQVDEELNAFLLRVPNLPHSSVPQGRTSDDNEEIRKWGTLPDFSFDPKNPSIFYSNRFFLCVLNFSS